MNKFMKERGFLMIASFIFAFVIWLAVTNGADPLTDRTFNNIKVIELNKSMILSTGKRPSITGDALVSFVVEGKTSAVNALQESDFYVTIDYAELSEFNTIPVRIKLLNVRDTEFTIKRQSKNTISVVLIEE
ncbi:MAG: hypothetical protein MJ113_06470 [Lachnospiraceae bacterium]|nr:hypothetical protein [Lachnospiraceae bacterium]